MKIACCLMVRNESNVIREWIAYHHLLGFDGFIIVNHKSTDDTADLALSAQSFTTVNVVDELRDPPGLQPKVYMSVVERFKDEYDWVSFIDADEFIASPTEDSIRPMLQSDDVAGVAIPWMIFGSSGLEERTEKLVVEDFTQCSKTDFGPNRHTKSIVRPKAVQSCPNAHCFKLDGKYITPDGADVEWSQLGLLKAYPNNSLWQVNHYYTRSRADWARRIERGQLGMWKRTWKEFDSYDRNERTDLSAVRRAPEVRSVLSREQLIPQESGGFTGA